MSYYYEKLNCLVFAFFSIFQLSFYPNFFIIFFTLNVQSSSFFFKFISLRLRFPIFYGVFIAKFVAGLEVKSEFTKLDREMKISRKNENFRVKFVAILILANAYVYLVIYLYLCKLHMDVIYPSRPTGLTEELGCLVTLHFPRNYRANDLTTVTHTRAR